MTAIIVTFALLVRALFFAPLITLDFEPAGKCTLVHPFAGGLCVPFCSDSRAGEPSWAYQWCGTLIEVP